MLYFFVRGLKPGAFAKQLVGDKPTSMDDLKVRAEKWIRIEEWEKAQAAKKDDKAKIVPPNQSRGKDDKSRDRSPKKRKGLFNNYTPLVVPPASVLKEVMHSELRERPPPLKTVGKHKNKYCEYHRDRGHSTNECIQLRDAIEKLIRQGRLRNYARASPERRDRRQSPSPQT